MLEFNFKDNYILQDEVALLRPLEYNDYQDFLPFSLHEPENWFYSLANAHGEENLKTYINTAIKNRVNNIEYPFTVVDKRTNEIAGCTRFYDIQLQYKTLQLGYTWYGNKFKGTGLNKHCKYLLLQFAFEQIGVERFELRADSRNVRSIAAMKSIGCTVEGILRNHLPTREESGVRRSSIVLSIIKDEWYSHVKDSLYNKLVQ